MRQVTANLATLRSGDTQEEEEDTDLDFVDEDFAGESEEDVGVRPGAGGRKQGARAASLVVLDEEEHLAATRGARESGSHRQVNGMQVLFEESLEGMRAPVSSEHRVEMLSPRKKRRCPFERHHESGSWSISWGRQERSWLVHVTARGGHGQSLEICERFQPRDGSADEVATARQRAKDFMCALLMKRAVDLPHPALGRSGHCAASGSAVTL